MMVVNAVKCFRYSVLSMIKRLMSLLLTVVVSAAASLYAQVEFKRGLEQISFVPKGQWITGVNVSFSQSNQDNYQFFIVEDINGDTYSYKISPMLMYCFKDNLAGDSETDYTVENLYQISHNYSAMACFRNYISLGRSHRFGFFNEVQLQFGGGESKIISGTGQDLTGTFERNWNMNIGLAPGDVPQQLLGDRGQRRSAGFQLLPFLRHYRPDLRLLAPLQAGQLQNQPLLHNFRSRFLPVNPQQT